MNQVIGIAICLAGSFAFAQFEDADPVVRTKAHRALNNGHGHDLPPIPRGLTEPPPLPPPELHTHDIRKQRRGGTMAAKRHAKGRTAKGKAHSKAAPVAPSNAPKPKAAAQQQAAKTIAKK
jgi:hypothetical protein